MDLTRVAVIASGECIRQHVGIERLSTLLRGYEDAVAMTDFTVENIVSLAGVIEPDNGGVLRSTPVTFSGGGSSANAEDIPRLLSQLVDFFHSGHLTASEFTREFLWIHPFSDGNGRTAWVLFNYLSDTMDAPLALPYFDFDHRAVNNDLDGVLDTIEVREVTPAEVGVTVSVGSRVLPGVEVGQEFYYDRDGDLNVFEFFVLKSQRLNASDDLFVRTVEEALAGAGQQVLDKMRSTAVAALHFAGDRSEHYLSLHVDRLRIETNEYLSTKEDK